MDKAMEQLAVTQPNTAIYDDFDSRRDFAAVRVIGARAAMGIYFTCCIFYLRHEDCRIVHLAGGLQLCAVVAPQRLIEWDELRAGTYVCIFIAADQFLFRQPII